MGVTDPKPMSNLRLIDVVRGGSLTIVDQDDHLAAATVVPLDAHVTSDVERDALLGQLREAQDPDAEQVVLRALGRYAQSVDDLSRAYLREQVMATLAKHGRSSPARIVDAILPGREITTPVASIVQTIEPWDQAVDGAGLLHDLSTVYTRYVVLPAGAAEALALWTLHTHVYERHMITPRLTLTSPEKRCGKTTLLSLLNATCCRPISASNMTPAVTFRLIELQHPTLLVDEADTFLSDASELRGILNAGNRRGGCVLRTVGDDHEPKAFDVFAPLAIAAIGKIPDTLIDRSIVIPMRRRNRDEVIERFRLDRTDHLRDLARQAARWAEDHGLHLDLDPDVPEALHDRAGDNWRCLLSIADRAGGQWPARARSAALTLSAVGAGDDESIRVLLLGDIRAIYETLGVSRIATADLLAHLLAMEERPWAEWSHGRPMTAEKLAQLLRPFGIRSAQWRDGAARMRGYDREDCNDAWGRYL